MSAGFVCPECGRGYTEEEYIKYRGDCQECGEMLSWIGKELPKSEIMGE